jgi:prepilin-type N-terminal cleavage/methylation domain-containing protein
MNRARSVPIRCAFTLIELLISISVIATLIGILLPALGSARDAARAAVCLSNQKQIITGWTLYAHDHADRVMPLALTEEADVGSGDGRFWWGSDGSVSGIIDHSAGFLAPYLSASLGARSAFECPSQPAGTYIPQGSPLIPEDRRFTTTYGYNGYYLSPSKTPGWSGAIGAQPWKRLSDLDRPTELLAFADTLLPTSPSRPGRSSALLDPPMLYQGDGQWAVNEHPTTSFRHGARGQGTTGVTNAAAADGSARAHAAEPGWITHRSHRVGSVGRANDPGYVPDWSRWR